MKKIFKGIMLQTMSLILMLSILGFASAEEIIKDESVKNEKLAQAIINETKVDEENNDRYVYYYEDINNDNKDEVIVYLWGMDFSGTGGGTMMIFSKEKSGYKFISRTTLVRMPIIISETTTNGYNDIIVSVSGGGIPNSFNAILKYNHGIYPLNPSIQPKINKEEIKAKRIIATEITPDSGFKLGR